MKKFLLLLVIVLIWTGLNGKKLSRLSELTNPSIMKSDGEQIYVLDGYQISIYSLKDYKMLNKFGKKGEGPGELLAQPDLPLTMSLENDYIIVNSFNKIVCFSKKGAYIKEKKIPFLAMQVLPFGKGYAASKFSRNSDGSGTLDISLYDAKFKSIKTISNSKVLNDQGKGKISFPILGAHLRVADNTLFIVDQRKDFQLDIYGLDGEQINTITNKYKKIKITKEYKKEKMEWLKLQPAFKRAPERIKKMIYFLDFLPAIDHFLVNDNRIYLQTSNHKKKKVEFFILNKNGNIEKQVMLPNAKIESIRPTPAANYFFKKGAYYFLKEVEEEWELHRVKL